MTIPHWGRLTPVQIYMLSLAGHVIPPPYDEPDIVAPDTERLRSMTEGREDLRRMTGKDFGFDLASWHDYLIEDEGDWGYTHPYGWRQTRQAVEAAMHSPDRLRLVNLLETDETPT